MGERFIDLTGRRFGRLVVIGRVSNNKYKELYWLCKCDCGNEKEIRGQNLKSGFTTSCGCYNKEQLFNGKYRIEHGLSSKRSVFLSYRNGAKRRKISFEITFEQFLELSQQRCHYCDSELSNFWKGNGNGSFTYNGIDRKDNTKGYTIENSVPCCKKCNEAKNDQPYDEYIKWILKSADNIRSKILIGGKYAECKGCLTNFEGTGNSNSNSCIW